MLIRRNCSRQGKTSEGNEAVVTYGDSSESPDNAVLRILYNQHRVAEADTMQDETCGLGEIVQDKAKRAREMKS